MEMMRSGKWVGGLYVNWELCYDGYVCRQLSLMMWIFKWDSRRSLSLSFSFSVSISVSVSVSVSMQPSTAILLTTVVTAFTYLPKCP